MYADVTCARQLYAIIPTTGRVQDASAAVGVSRLTGPLLCACVRPGDRLPPHRLPPPIGQAEGSTSNIHLR